MDQNVGAVTEESQRDLISMIFNMEDLAPYEVKKAQDIISGMDPNTTIVGLSKEDLRELLDKKDISQRGQQQPVANPQNEPINWQIPQQVNPSQISYEDAVKKIHRDSVKDLNKDPNIRNYLYALSTDYYGVKGFTENDSRVVAIKAKILNAIQNNELSTINSENLRMYYPEGLQNNDDIDIAAEVEKIDAVYKVRDDSVAQRKDQQPRNEQPEKSYQFQEYDQAELKKAIEESKKTANDRKNYLSDKEFDLYVSELGYDLPQTWKSDLKNSDLSKEEQSQNRRALSNISEESREKNVKGLKRTLDHNKKDLRKVVSGFSHKTSEQDIHKLWGIVASEFCKILKIFTPSDNDSDNIADFKSIAGRYYERKSPRDQDKFLSEFSKIESFLIGSPQDYSAFDEDHQPFNIQSKKELLDMMKKTQKYLKINEYMMKKSELYVYKMNKVEKERLIKQAEKETDTEKKEELLKQASEIKTERTKNRLDLIEENVENLIKCVGEKPIASLLRGKISKQTNHRLNAFSKQFGLSNSEDIQNFIQNQKSDCDIFGLEQSKALISKWIPEQAIHSESVCKNVTEKLEGKKQALKRLIKAVITRTDPFYGHFRLNADIKKINNFLDGRIENLVQAAKNQLNSIQEEKNSLSDSAMIRTKRLEHFLSKQQSIKKDEINSGVISEENQNTVAISEKDQILNHSQNVTVNKKTIKVTKDHIVNGSDDENENPVRSTYQIGHHDITVPPAA